MSHDEDGRGHCRMSRIRNDAEAPEAALARDLRAMIDAARSPEERKTAEAAAADLRKRAGLQ
jgi:hypothetical protein